LSRRETKMKKTNLNALSGLRSIKAPEELKERTLRAAMEITKNADNIVLESTGPRHLKPTPRRRGLILKRTLAAACVFGIALGGGTAMYRSKKPDASPSDTVAKAIMNSFGFVAYAANTGETITPKNSTIVFDSDSGSDSPEDGLFSGCLFKVTGDNIKSVSANIDKGSIYRTKRVNLPDKEVAGAFIRGEAPEIEDADNVMVSGTGDEADGANEWWADVCWKLENGFTEEYDPDVSYGFWAPPSTEPEDPDADLQAEWHSHIDFFEGATLNVTVTFTDGSTQVQTIKIHTGKLGVDYNDAGMYLTGEVFTEQKDYGKPYVYGVYGEIM